MDRYIFQLFMVLALDFPGGDGRPCHHNFSQQLACVSGCLTFLPWSQFPLQIWFPVSTCTMLYPYGCSVFGCVDIALSQLETHLHWVWQFVSSSLRTSVNWLRHTGAHIEAFETVQERGERERASTTSCVKLVVCLTGLLWQRAANTL